MRQARRNGLTAYRLVGKGDPVRWHIHGVAKTFYYEKPNNLFSSFDFPRTVKVPEHLVAARHPFCTGGRLRFSSFTLYDNNQVLCFYVDIRLRRSFENEPVFALGVIS